MKKIDLRDKKFLIKDAKNPFSRLRGLLFTRKKAGHGIVLYPCKGIHTYMMSYSIQVIVLDRNKEVIRVVNELKPNKILNGGKEWYYIIELPAKSVGDVLIGDYVSW